MQHLIKYSVHNWVRTPPAGSTTDGLDVTSEKLCITVSETHWRKKRGWCSAYTLGQVCGAALSNNFRVNLTVITISTKIV